MKYILCLLLLSACATPVTVMQRQDDVVTCGGGHQWSTALGWAGYHIEQHYDRECVEDYNSQGYKIIKQ